MNNAIGTVAFLTTSPSAGLHVSADGTISTTGALAPGLYTVAGTDSDGYGDTGTWTYALTVTGVAITVTFDANGGRGTMAAQSGGAPTALTSNGFARAGYRFTGWNTAANGSGSGYTNGAAYPFTASVTLYAQWKALKVVTIPGVRAVVTLGQFATGSSTLSAALTAQVTNLAREIKANRDTNIALVGYGDILSAADQLNELAWAKNLKLSTQRATVVEGYLKSQLSLVGVTRYTITVAGDGSANPASPGGTSAGQANDGRVVATIT